MSMCPIICIHMLHDGIWIHLYIGEIIETPMFSRTKNHQSSWVLSHVFYSVKSLFSHVLCIKIHEKNELVHPLSLPDPFPRKSHGKSPEDFFGGLKKKLRQFMIINHLWELMISYKIDGIVRCRF